MRLFPAPRLSLALLLGLLLTLSSSSHAGAYEGLSERFGPEGVLAPLAEEPSTTEHPDVHLDHLGFPRDVVGAKNFERHLRKALKRESYRADWGAGSKNRIEFRFLVTELKYTVTDDALRVHCSAVGKLPGGKQAKSRLSFGGKKGERIKLTKRVLEIVARGVITRLAELERIRRGLR